MGIPALFRWLSQKYPKSTSQVVEEVPKDLGPGLPLIPVDPSQPNPNGVEFDHLYLDMNGIIHPCCHPEDRPAPTTQEEMFVAIFAYIDRILAIVRPRRLLYMAIDGVAPRAKMNQQRSRRFRAAREEAAKRVEEQAALDEWISKGNPPPSKAKAHFDSNCITPGTPFMADLAIALRYYIASRLNSAPGWRELKVILSDASIPGEGEHKIMDFIRRQRREPGYNPNTSHVLYGLDADLIMLALATHEPHFKILREDVFFNDGKDRGCFVCGQTGHNAAECTGKKKEIVGEFDEKSVARPEKPYIFLHVSVLREYLEIELKVLDIPFEWNLERAIDDWVFLCFFVGNDFLPHLPSLEIREGAIDKLVSIWKGKLASWGGYVTENGAIHLERVETLLASIGKLEDNIFQERREAEVRRREARERKRRELRDRQSAQRDREFGDRVSRSARLQVYQKDIESYSVTSSSKPPPAKKAAVMIPSVDSNKAAAELLKQSLLQSKEVAVKEESVSEVTSVAEAEDNEDPSLGPTKRKAHDESYTDAAADVEDLQAAAEVEDSEVDLEQVLEEELEEAVEDDSMAFTGIPPVEKVVAAVVAKDVAEEEAVDNVRLWESGWKHRYYTTKFHVEADDRAFKSKLIESYVEGLAWVLKYYYQGVQSWKWFFPYHYAPFASDFDGISSLTITFELGTPFLPIEQLMGVFPAASKSHIPAPFHSLMENEDSPIIDFYPVNFPIDMDGKKYEWQGVALLPFIDESRLLKKIKPLYALLTPEEVKRNSCGNEVLFFGKSHPLFDPLCAVYGTGDDSQQEMKIVRLNPQVSQNLFGACMPDPEVTLPGSTVESPLLMCGLADVSNNRSLSVMYFMPVVPAKHIFTANLLAGVRMPLRILDLNDAFFVRSGRGRGGRGRGRGSHRGESDRRRFDANDNTGFSNQIQSSSYASSNASGYASYSRPGQSSAAIGYNVPGNQGYSSSNYSQRSVQQTHYSGGRGHSQYGEHYNDHRGGFAQRGHNQPPYSSSSSNNSSRSNNTGYGYQAPRPPPSYIPPPAGSYQTYGGGYSGALPHPMQSYGYPNPPNISPATETSILQGLLHAIPGGSQAYYPPAPHPSSWQHGMPPPAPVAAAHRTPGGVGGNLGWNRNLSNAQRGRGGGSQRPPPKNHVRF